MASTTGIELSPDSCVLVRARPARDGAEVSAFHVIHRDEWPSHDLAVAPMIRAIRRRLRFPHRARVAVWGLPEDVATDNPIVTALVKPVTAAGFRVESVMSPPQALAALARTRTRGGGSAFAWIAANVHGAAIAIVRDGELLYSRTFDWAYRPAAAGSKAELLQRYSLVAHLGPEVRRGISTVRSSHGVAVEAVVTCGDLPDLRSLTMPLIEELDLEVETLDSTEGLVLASRGPSDRFAELAPAMRLACAAATGGARRARRLMPVGAVAAALLVLAGAAWGGFVYWPSGIRPTGTQSASPVPAVPKPALDPASSTVRSAAPASTAGAPETTIPRTEGTAGAAAGTRSAVLGARGATRPSTGPPSAAAAAAPPSPPSTSGSSSGPERTPPIRESSQRESGGPTAARDSALPPGLPPGAPAPPLFPAYGRTTEDERTKPPLLDAPLPAIDSILISHDRRLAVIGRSIVGIGDSVGQRVVVAIERDAVVFREPSGREVRVALRSGPGRP